VEATDGGEAALGHTWTSAYPRKVAARPVACRGAVATRAHGSAAGRQQHGSGGNGGEGSISDLGGARAQQQAAAVQPEVARGATATRARGTGRNGRVAVVLRGATGLRKECWRGSECKGMR
jgi:hypothetical protein